MFKLLREAQALEKLGDKAPFAKQVQQILGVQSITDVMESAPYEITPQDYQQWLPAIIDIAAERGVNINKKVEFMDLAHDLLDNDPKMDAIGGDSAAARRKVVSALWQMFKVNQAHGEVKDHVASAVTKAREEEEAANDLVGAEGGFEQAFDTAKGVENEEIVKRRRNPYQPGTLRAMLWDEQNKGAEDEEFDDMDDMGDEGGAGEEMPPADVDTDAMSPDDLASHIQGAAGDMDDEGGDDLDTRVDDLEARVADLEAGEAGEDHGDEVLDDEVPADMDSEMDMPDRHGEEKVVDIPEEEEEKVSVSDLFRKAITSPKEHMSAALKAVEDEGASAWTAMTVPTNPHPKKSPAFHAWMKGFKGSAKEHLGIVDKPREVTSKHRGKKK
jgi:hypothetical protein